MSFASGLPEAFEDFYYSDKISSRHCGRNIKNFIKDLKRNGFDTSGIKVLKITAAGNSWGFGRIVALNSRWGKSLDNHFVENWGFHVVAVHNGEVYDFSFSREPTILKFDDYVESMFVAQNPILLYGKSFRVRGEGPYYTPEISRDELSSLVFESVD